MGSIARQHGHRLRLPRGGNLDIDRTQVIEAYARFVLNKDFALTVDLQYMYDDLVGGGGPEGFIPGLRVVCAI